MTLLPVVENSVSGLLIVLAWWLAHQAAAEQGRFGRVMACSLTLLALSVMVELALCLFEDHVDWLPFVDLVNNLALLVTLAGISAHLARLGRHH